MFSSFLIIWSVIGMTQVDADVMASRRLAPGSSITSARSILERHRYNVPGFLNIHHSFPSILPKRRRRRKLANDQSGVEHMMTRQDVMLQKLFERMRGGSTDEEEVEDDDDEKEEALESPMNAAANEEFEDDTKKSPTKDAPPVTLLVQSNTGTPLLDAVLELPLVQAHRTIGSIKQSVHRQWPAKPPLSAIQLVYQGQRLTEDSLRIADLLEDDDDDDDDEYTEDEGRKLVFYLDMIPSVDPKSFLAELETKLNDVTNAELLQAYATNEAALYYNSLVLASESRPEEEEKKEEDGSTTDIENAPLTAAAPVFSSTRLRERATQIQQNLESSILSTPRARAILAATETPLSRSTVTREVRGQRVRYTGFAGLPGQTKRLVQREFNIEDWYQTCKHCLLFLFFGWFGGRTALSRTILLLGAPGIFLVQARSVKAYLRHALYALLDHPPAILLSLFPAPQQAILSMNVASALQTLYGPHVERNAALMAGWDEDEMAMNHQNIVAEKMRGDVDEEYDDSDDDEEEEDDDYDDEEEDEEEDE